MRERYSKFLIFILLFCITGCSNTSQMEQKNIENGNNAELKQNIQKETEPVVEICYDLFRKADDEGSMGDLTGLYRRKTIMRQLSTTPV